MLDMGFREDLEEILDATPGAPHPALLGDHAEADRRARQALPEGCAAHLDRRRGSRPWRHQLPGGDRRAGRHRECGGEPAAPPRGGIGDAVLRHPRQCPAPPRQPHRARLRAVALSGEHSQNERNQALQALRDRRARVCVATDVAARGIDLPTCRSSSTSSCRATPRRSSTAPAAPAARARRARRSCSSPIRAASASR
jgi:ATP-dependent RNA helicase DeaD